MAPFVNGGGRRGVAPARAREAAMALPDPAHILFYGTLMSGFALRRRAAIEPFVRFVGPGVVRAALFDLGPYPAAIRAEGTVRGELYAVTRADRLLPRVDAIEGCVPGDVLRSQYVREAVEVRLERGPRRRAWIYFYARPLGATVWIPGGDYRAYLARRLSRRGCARRLAAG